MRMEGKHCSRGKAFWVGELVHLKLCLGKWHFKENKKISLLPVLWGRWSHQVILENKPTGRVKVHHYDKLQHTLMKK